MGTSRPFPDGRWCELYHFGRVLEELGFAGSADRAMASRGQDPDSGGFRVVVPEGGHHGKMRQIDGASLMSLTPYLPRGPALGALDRQRFPHTQISWWGSCPPMRSSARWGAAPFPSSKVSGMTSTSQSPQNPWNSQGCPPPHGNPT